MPAIQHSQGKSSFYLQLRLLGRVLGFVHSQSHVFCLRIQCKVSSQKDRELIFYVILCCYSTVSNLSILFQKKEVLHQNEQKKYFLYLSEFLYRLWLPEKNISHLLISTLAAGQNREHEYTGNCEQQHWALTWYLWCPGEQSSPPFCQVHWSTGIFRRWAHHSLSQPDLLLSCTREGLASSQTCRTSHCD